MDKARQALWKQSPHWVGNDLGSPIDRGHDEVQCVLGTVPMLQHDVATGALHQVGERQGYEDEVVQQSDAEEEVRDEVDRRDDVPQHQGGQHFADDRNPWIPNQAAEESGGVGKKPDGFPTEIPPGAARSGSAEEDRIHRLEVNGFCHGGITPV